MSTPSWPILAMAERRVLGVMVEKAKTTPDVYPMSVNGIVVGSNQKSNRDPILNLSDDDVENTLSALQPKGYVTRIQGGRVERWRHNLYDLWSVNKVELAILVELLLRGPQTDGELRQRASRMEAIEDLPALRDALKPLAERKLVAFLGTEGRRGTLISHGFHSPKEIEIAQSRVMTEESVVPTISAPVPIPAGELARLSGDLQEARHEISELRNQLGAMQAVLTQTVEHLNKLRESLGA
ncbi:MAG: DUF480 domain-containing protein [Gemmataceae bacterium]|nr:DUF480 domain-containing protein [Gemmataceae bacterium]